jgi:hypothetical protein
MVIYGWFFAAREFEGESFNGKPKATASPPVFSQTFFRSKPLKRAGR